MEMQLDANSIEKLVGIVERITFHNEENGWTVIKVTPFNRRGSKEEIPVILHQVKIFPGATMEFYGKWITHAKFGDQFQACRVQEVKPASEAALEKYLGSGLIFGLGPKTAKKIVQTFKGEALEVFEKDIKRLLEVPGISSKKLKSIKDKWQEHVEIREVVMFLQSHGVSTLFAVKIYKAYGKNTISIITQNPYRLAQDIYGIGFHSADKIALKIGVAENSKIRHLAAIRHILNQARENGHCYLLKKQIFEEIKVLLQTEDITDKQLQDYLDHLEITDEIKSKINLKSHQKCYYAKSLFYDEHYCAKWFASKVSESATAPIERISDWLRRFNDVQTLKLSSEQLMAVEKLSQNSVGILTGGPGCGKTTTVKTLVQLFIKMQKTLALCAPTGRAAQRMTEVLGREAKTIHRLLEFKGGTGGFLRGVDNPLQVDVVIVDEVSMIDISLMRSLCQAIAPSTQLVLVGDPDQLPSVGPGQVLNDLLHSGKIVVCKLTQIFRQGKGSQIIEAAHQINQGVVPQFLSPFNEPKSWELTDALFIHADEASAADLKFIKKFKRFASANEDVEVENDLEINIGKENLVIPKKYLHVDLDKLTQAETLPSELQCILKRISPYSTLFWGHTASSFIPELYSEIIPKYHPSQEIQILTPMTRGSLGSHKLNELIQERSNPKQFNKKEIAVAGKKFREGDRVIQKRNNYDLMVFNGDIGKIITIDNSNLTVTVDYASQQVMYQKEQLLEIDLAYAITIHKSQGSEFDVVILPLMTQAYKMLFRNLLYTGITRAKKRLILVGSVKALKICVHQINFEKRQTLLAQDLAKIVN